MRIIHKYIAQLNDNFHRYHSWELCYTQFQQSTDKELLSLHLAFFLASWGMYRGSSQLLQKNYLIHKGAVSIIQKYKKRYPSLPHSAEKYCLYISSFTKELKRYYQSYDISPTDTLLSKIILGTTAHLPALDRYFLKGVKRQKLEFTSLSENSLIALYNYVETHKENILKYQKEIYNKTNKTYPIMKIIDMYFWSQGFSD